MLVEAVRQFNRGGVDSCPSFFGRRDDLLRRKDHSSHAGVSHFQRVRVSNTGHTFRPILARACTYMSFGYFNTHTRNRISKQNDRVLHDHRNIFKVIALNIIIQFNTPGRACFVFLFVVLLSFAFT